MNLPILAVDKNIAVHERENAVWRERGINGVRVDSMSEAIEKADRQDFLFIAINADNIIYLPMLPVMKETSATPILIVTSDFSTHDQVEALHSGADVYAPFQRSTEDNILSALALLHRHSEQHKQKRKNAHPISYGKLFAFPSLRQVFYDDQEIVLTKTEFDILIMFIRNPWQVQTFEMIFEHVWNEPYTLASKKTVNNHVGSLRKKITAAPAAPEHIQSIHSVGYKFVPI